MSAVRIKLDPAGVVRPIQNAVRDTLEVLSISIAAVRSSDLSVPVPRLESWMAMEFKGETRTPEEKMLLYQNWILSKGLQEYARSVRQSLEEAYLYTQTIKAFENGALPESNGDVRKFLDKIRRSASSKKFPDLMSIVNKELLFSLKFEEEFLSIQKIRNCLEHRDGVVGDKDVAPGGGALLLTFPRLGLFVEENGNQVEIGPGYHVEKDQMIAVRLMVDRREYEVGSKITLSVNEVAAVGWGCWAFSLNLFSALPKSITPTSSN